MVKPTGWVVDMRHYIDEDTGDLPEVIPERVLSLAIFFGAIVAWVTDHLPEGDEHTNVPCRRSPGRRRCRGDIIAQLDRSLDLIRFRGQFPKGGYDVHNGESKEPAASPTVHG